MAATMRAVQVPHAGGPFELVERPLPQPGPREVRIRVEACGVCHSDASAKNGGFPGQIYPVIPGHEIAGTIDAVGEGVVGWSVGQRVGAGWFGGACFRCERCRRGDFMTCQTPSIHGVTRDGGYAEAVIAADDALALIPDELKSVEAAPMLCAGVTTFNALARCGARPGAVVAVMGIGGLGHLAIQFAAKMGFVTVAIARGAEKANLALGLGAHHYIDSTVQNVAAELRSLGGAAALLATGSGADGLAGAINGLTIDGRLVMLGVPGQPIPVYAYQVLYGRSLTGSAGGTGVESQDTMRFSALTGVRPMIETLPLERAAEAYDRMMAGDARFRIVLTPPSPFSTCAPPARS
jgi:D-arabinose 1-dehydrogenase-like Zn-dependent alcohol dehydrogenase